MKTYIIGAGEVGGALANVLRKQYGVIVVDTDTPVSDFRRDGESVMHICFPYTEAFFVDEVERYQALYKPTYTVIHSTVPVGTSRACGALHSPVIGIHPFLYEGIKTFTKFIGGDGASQVADYFRRAGLKVYLFDEPETTELLKILDTTKYAVDIEYTKDVKRQCEKFRVPFEAWTLYLENYNLGYEKLGYPEYRRPNLVPIMKKQGGHCTRNNCDLLETPFTKIVRDLNDNHG